MSNFGYAADAPLNKQLEPPPNDEVSNVFRDMGVVQQRAMKKGGRFLFSLYESLDFSDGPYTNYSINLNPGYAISDFFEIYINYVPAFQVSARSIVGLVQNLQLANGATATLVEAKPQSQYGLELLWAPAYGKDSIGIHHVIRSDTFFKLSVGQVNYDTDTGLRFVLGVGKTYFLTNWLGLRFTVDYDDQQTVLNSVKAFQSFLLIEAGFMFYL